MVVTLPTSASARKFTWTSTPFETSSWLTASPSEAMTSRGSLSSYPRLLEGRSGARRVTKEAPPHPTPPVDELARGGDNLRTGDAVGVLEACAERLGKLWGSDSEATFCERLADMRHVERRAEEAMREDDGIARLLGGGAGWQRLVVDGAGRWQAELLPRQPPKQPADTEIPCDATNVDHVGVGATRFANRRRHAFWVPKGHGNACPAHVNLADGMVRRHFHKAAATLLS
eukprot:scaffold9290_cov63-Phaeocystis_antarctica.AAC.4